MRIPFISATLGLLVPVAALAQDPQTPNPSDRVEPQQSCEAARRYGLNVAPLGADGVAWRVHRDGQIVQEEDAPANNRGRVVVNVDLRRYGSVLDGTSYAFEARATSGGEPVAEWSDPAVFDRSEALPMSAVVIDSSSSAQMLLIWTLPDPIAHCADGLRWTLEAPDTGAVVAEGSESGTSGQIVLPVSDLEGGYYPLTATARYTGEAQEIAVGAPENRLAAVSSQPLADLVVEFSSTPEPLPGQEYPLEIRVENTSLYPSPVWALELTRIDSRGRLSVSSLPPTQTEGGGSAILAVSDPDPPAGEAVTYVASLLTTDSDSTNNSSATIIQFPEIPAAAPEPVPVTLLALDQAAAACVARAPSVSGATLRFYLGEDLVETATTDVNGATVSLVPGTYRVVADAGHCEETETEMRLPGAVLGAPLDGCVSKAASFEVEILDVPSIPPGGPLPLAVVVHNTGEGISPRSGLRIERVEGTRITTLGPGTYGIDPICGGQERIVETEDPGVKQGETYSYRATLFAGGVTQGSDQRDVTMPAPIQEIAEIVEAAPRLFVFDTAADAKTVTDYAQARGWSFIPRRVAGDGDCHMNAGTVPAYTTTNPRLSPTHEGSVTAGTSMIAHALSRFYAVPGYIHGDTRCHFEFFRGSPLADGWRISQVSLGSPFTSLGETKQSHGQVLIQPSGVSPFFIVEVFHKGITRNERKPSFTRTGLTRLVLEGPPSAKDWKEAFDR